MKLLKLIVRRLFYFFILPTMVIWNTNSIATSPCYKLRLWMWVVCVAFAYNGRRYVALRNFSRNLINNTNDKIYKKLI